MTSIKGRGGVGGIDFSFQNSVSILLQIVGFPFLFGILFQSVFN